MIVVQVLMIAGWFSARRHRLGAVAQLTVEREEHRERRDRRLVDHGREQLVRAPEVRLDGAQSERSSGLCRTLALQCPYCEISLAHGCRLS